MTCRNLAVAPPGATPRRQKPPHLKPAQWLALAERHYRAVLKVRANHPGARFNLGVLLTDHLQRPAEGKTLLARFLKQVSPASYYEAQRYAKRKLLGPAARP